MKNTLIVFFYLATSLVGVIRPPLLISPLKIDEGAISPVILSKEKKKKDDTPKEPTNWGGNELSQEEKEIEGIKAKVYSLKGGAWLMHKKVKLSAYSIEIIGQDALKGFLKGKVKVEDTEHNITLTGANGVYDKLAETIVLKGRPTLTYIDKNKKKTKISSPYIKRYMGESKTILEKEVLVENPDYTIFGDSAIYYENEKVLELDNYPFIFGEESFLTGKKATYNSEDKKAILEEETLLFRLSMENEKKKKDKTSVDKKENTNEKVRIISLFSGDKLIYDTNSEGEKTIGMYGNAHLVRPDLIFDANYIKAFGENSKNIEAKDSIQFLDLENHVKLMGNTLEHNEENGYTHITDDTKVEFLNKDNSKVQATMTAMEIERFNEKKEIVARGDVKVKTENSTLYGEYATYYEEKENMVLEGNPRMTKDKNTVRSGKIILYPSKNRVLLTDGIKSN